MQVYSANLWNGCVARLPPAPLLLLLADPNRLLSRRFDLAFVVIYLAYVSLRGWGLAHVLGGGGLDREWSAVLGVDLLAIGACVMFPRLVFVSLRYVSLRLSGPLSALGANPARCTTRPRVPSDNIMILALRSMIMEFAMLMMIAVFWCVHLASCRSFLDANADVHARCRSFLGFLYALWTLSEKSISIGTVSWWLLDIFFGALSLPPPRARAGPY